jgi:hypothetical protein
VDEPIDITELGASPEALAVLLKCLHGGTKPMGLGIYQAQQEVTYEECLRALAPLHGRFDFDYFRGRPLKVHVLTRGQESFLHGAWLYDLRAPDGPGSCLRAVEEAKRQWKARGATKSPVEFR